MRKDFVPVREYVFTAGAGAVVYAFLEIFWRGYTHWSMMIAGALSAVLLYWIREHLPGVPLFGRCLLGTVGITLVEFCIGCIVNLWWGLGVWDYSEMPWNLLGQICPAFSAMWFLLCMPAFWLCGQIRERLREK